VIPPWVTRRYGDKPWEALCTDCDRWISKRSGLCSRCHRDEHLRILSDRQQLQLTASTLADAQERPIREPTAMQVRILELVLASPEPEQESIVRTDGNGRRRGKRERWRRVAIRAIAARAGCAPSYVHATVKRFTSG
jgi:hypothetical protein